MQLTEEEFRPVHDEYYGIHGGYSVSNLGNVKNKYGRIIKGHITRRGYHQVTLSCYGLPKFFYVHRLVAYAFIGPPNSPSNEVNHKDLNKLNNRVDNLEWMVKGDNVRHAKSHGHHGRRYTDEQEQNIVVLRKRGWSYQKIADAFGCSKRRIFAICKRRMEL
ncbi:MAG: HNH endonuclease [Blastocatellia bacterium]|nr:HNH endonuclease [Blastocatellia bacterium]